MGKNINIYIIKPGYYNELFVFLSDTRTHVSNNKNLVNNYYLKEFCGNLGNSYGWWDFLFSKEYL